MSIMKYYLKIVLKYCDFTPLLFINLYKQLFISIKALRTLSQHDLSKNQENMFEGLPVRIIRLKQKLHFYQCRNNSQLLILMMSFVAGVKIRHTVATFVSHTNI